MPLIDGHDSLIDFDPDGDVDESALDRDYLPPTAPDPASDHSLTDGAYETEDDSTDDDTITSITEISSGENSDYPPSDASSDEESISVGEPNDDDTTTTTPPLTRNGDQPVRMRSVDHAVANDEPSTATKTTVGKGSV